MMPAVGFGLVLLSCLAVATEATTSRLERVAFSGTEYVRLDQWASRNGLKGGGTIRNREVRLTNSGTTLVFETDSQKVLINGVTVYLSAPMGVRSGLAYITPVDLANTLEPLLFPARQDRSNALICLDAGHGGKDPGHLGGKEKEKKYTLLLARELGEQLRKAGFKVCYTRTKDTFLELGARAELAQKRGADLFVSLHFNAWEGPGPDSAKGAEVYCMTPARTSSTNAKGEGSDSGSYAGNRFDAKNILLAYNVQKSLISRLGLEDRGVKRARYAVLRMAEMPAILIESGFLSNPGESKRIYDPQFRQQLAQAIVRGIQGYDRAVSRERISTAGNSAD